MSLCTLVDRDDNIIGYRERDQLKPGDIYRVASLWVINSIGQMLLAQRSSAKRLDPGKWAQAAAGTIENKESYDDNIIKEAREELDVANIAFKRGPKLFVADNGYGQGYFVQTFVVVLDWPVEQFRLQTEEVEAIRWIGIAELEQELETSPEHFITNFSVLYPKMIAFLREYTFANQQQ